MNLAPVLVCDRCRLPKLHIFVERRAQRRWPGELPFADCVYACEACGAVRPWGNEPREETAYGRRLAGTDLAHALDAHGMRRESCPACRGLGLDCSQCGNEGRIWVFGAPAPCRRRCPLAAFDRPESE